MDPPELRADLKQEIFLIICEMEETKLVELYKTDKIRFHIVRIIINQIQSSNSPFYYKYRKIKVSEVEFNPWLEQEEKPGKYMQDHPIEEINKITDEELIKQCQSKVENLYWYDQTIIKLYAEHGSLRAVSEAIKIPFTSIASTVRKVRKEIKGSLNYG